MSCHFSLTCWMWRGVKIEEHKDEGAIFFILNLSLLTMPWSTSSHKPFTRLLPVNGRDVLLRRRRHLHETLYWVGWMSFSQTGGTLQSSGLLQDHEKPCPVFPKSQLWVQFQINVLLLLLRADGQMFCRSLPMSPTGYITHTCSNRYILALP